MCVEVAAPLVTKKVTATTTTGTTGVSCNCCCCFLLFPTHPFPLPTSADVEFFEIVVIDLFDPDTFVYIAVQHRRQQHPHRILPSLGTAVDPCGAAYDRRKVVMV